MSQEHFVIRALMLDAATDTNIDVDRLSFKGSCLILKTRLQVIKLGVIGRIAVEIQGATVLDCNGQFELTP